MMQTRQKQKLIATASVVLGLVVLDICTSGWLRSSLSDIFTDPYQQLDFLFSISWILREEMPVSAVLIMTSIPVGVLAYCLWTRLGDRVRPPIFWGLCGFVLLWPIVCQILFYLSTNSADSETVVIREFIPKSRLHDLCIIPFLLLLGFFALHPLAKLIRKRFRSALAWGGFWMLAGNLFAAFFGGLLFSPGWEVGETVDAPDGLSYAYIERNLFQGQDIWLCTLEDEGSWSTEYKIVARTNGDSPRDWVPVIRPSGIANLNEKHLFLSPDDVLYGIRQDNDCYYAYDTRAKEFLGHGNASAISPFGLIGENTVMHEPDIATVRKEVFQFQEDPMWKYDPDLANHLRNARSHPNPAVHSLAIELSEAIINNERLDIGRILEEHSISGGETSLIHLSVNGSPEDVKRLLDQGANVNAKDKNDWTLLHWFASESASTESLQALIEHGAKLNARNLAGETPLMVALRFLPYHGMDYMGDFEEEDIVPDSRAYRHLIINGADVNMQDTAGWTPLHLAAKCGLAPVSLLLENGAEVNPKSRIKRTPLLLSLLEDHAETSILLLKQGASIEHSDENEWPPLFLAVRHDRAELVRVILEKGADPNAKYQQAGFPLSQSRSYDVAKVLIVHGADVNARLTGGMTVLHHNNNIGVIRACIEAGADVNAKDEEGRTPLYTAKYSSEKVRHLLKKHGGIK